MAVNAELYSELAKALSQPSKAYRAAKEGLGIPTSALEGYLSGSEAGDKIQSIKFGNQTLDEALGGNVPEGVSPYRNLSVKQFKPTAELLTGVGAVDKAQTGDHWLEKFNLSEEGRNKRQKDRQGFVREMVGAKGNKDAVAEGQDAMKAAEAMQSLNDDLDTLPEGKARLYSSPAAKVLSPSLAAKKSQILLYAGFSRGGKQLTGTELGVVVDALTPTALDDKASRHLKNKTFQDWAQGKIALTDAAKLLGPAGTRLMGIAQNQRLNEERKRSDLTNSLIDGRGEDLNSVFSQEGL